MIKKSIIFPVVFICFILSACTNLKHVEEVKKWELSITCAEESTEESYVITYDDTVIISKTGTLAFQNQNDFDVVVYLLRDNQHEEKIEIEAGGAAVFYQIEQETEYTLGCHADVKEGTEIKLMVYDGEETEVYSTEQNTHNNVVSFEGNEYELLEYPANEFYYYYNGNSHDNFEEVDGRYPIDSPQWNMVWDAGDLYCITNHVEEAKNYYANDDNYDWYIVIDEDDEEIYYPINVTNDELENIYKLEEMERTTSLFWEEFEEQGSLIKISKDGIVRGIISIIKYDGSWYWKSDVIDENRENDGDWPEYVQPLPETLSNKIK